jgi:hypothetical protein
LLAATDDPSAVAALVDDAYTALTALAVWTEEARERLIPAIDRLDSGE